MAQAPFPIHPEYTAIAIAYKNAKLIADLVLPRVKVSKTEFRYLEHTLEEGFTLPDTKVGRTSTPNEVTFSATEKPGMTEDFGLEDPVPQQDIDNAAGSNFDPLAHSTEMLTALLALAREKRTADLLFNDASYPVGNRTELGNNDKWSKTDTSKPIEKITEILDGMIIRPTIAVFGRAAFSKLAMHPDILKAVHGNEGGSGIARREQIRDLFELEEIYVGEAYLNTSKKGQTKSMARVWGKHAAFFHRDPTADVRRGTTFGITAQFSHRVAGTIQDPKIGLRGGQRVRVGESVRELITAPDLGYFVKNAVA